MIMIMILRPCAWHRKIDLFTCYDTSVSYLDVFHKELQSLEHLYYTIFIFIRQWALIKLHDFFIWNKILLLLQVSWIRKRDLHILTVGVHTYSSDARFAALHADGSDEWTLRVAPAQPRDSGAYECQVSTEPKISLSFRLTVVGKQFSITTLFRRFPELWVVFCIKRIGIRSISLSVMLARLPSECVPLISIIEMAYYL